MWKPPWMRQQADDWRSEPGSWVGPGMRHFSAHGGGERVATDRPARRVKWVEPQPGVIRLVDEDAD